MLEIKNYSSALKQREIIQQRSTEITKSHASIHAASEHAKWRSADSKTEFMSLSTERGNNGNIIKAKYLNDKRNKCNLRTNTKS